MRLAIHGNCQTQALHALMLRHAPLTERFEIVPLKPIQDMTPADRAALPALVASLDIFVFQDISAEYGLAGTDHLLGFLNGLPLRLPSMWLDGHMPDMTYFRDEDGVKASSEGIEFHYHSRLVASACASGLPEADAVRLFTDPDAIDPEFLWGNYLRGLAELKRREARCEILITDLIERKGPAWRGFHTVNHPHGEILAHAFNQLLAILEVEPMHARNVGDPLDLLRWPVTASARAAFGVESPTDLVLGDRTFAIDAFVRHFYDKYRDRPALLALNAHLFDAAWTRGRDRPCRASAPAHSIPLAPAVDRARAH